MPDGDYIRPRFAPDQVITVFRSQRRPEGESAYHELADEMQRAARAMPGFVDFKTFAADDGERVSLVTFVDRVSHDAWRDDPRHRLAQQRGRNEFYVDYSVQVGICAQVSQWRPEPD